MSRSPIVKHPDGRKVWEQKEGDYYEITGVDRQGKRFSLATTSWMHAKCINLWQGSRWLVRDKKRYLINRVTN